MPIAILPDIDAQRCIGCALCVQICTALTPDVLRMKSLEGWNRSKAFVFYPERCISDGACIGVCPTKSIFWMRPMKYTSGQPVPLHQGGVFANGWAEDAALDNDGKKAVISAQMDEQNAAGAAQIAAAQGA